MKEFTEKNKKVGFLYTHFNRIFIIRLREVEKKMKYTRQGNEIRRKRDV